MDYEFYHQHLADLYKLHSKSKFLHQEIGISKFAFVKLVAKFQLTRSTRKSSDLVEALVKFGFANTAMLNEEQLQAALLPFFTFQSLCRYYQSTELPMGVLIQQYLEHLEKSNDVNELAEYLGSTSGADDNDTQVECIEWIQYLNQFLSSEATTTKSEDSPSTQVSSPDDIQKAELIFTRILSSTFEELPDAIILQALSHRAVYREKIQAFITSQGNKQTHFSTRTRKTFQLRESQFQYAVQHLFYLQWWKNREELNQLTKIVFQSNVSIGLYEVEFTFDVLAVYFIGQKLKILTDTSTFKGWETLVQILLWGKVPSVDLHKALESSFRGFEYLTFVTWVLAVLENLEVITFEATHLSIVSRFERELWFEKLVKREARKFVAAILNSALAAQMYES